MTTLYIAVDIGCLECGEETAVLGAFTDQAAAESAAKQARAAQAEHWHGQHAFQVFEVAAVDTPTIPAYARDWEPDPT